MLDLNVLQIIYTTILFAVWISLLGVVLGGVAFSIAKGWHRGKLEAGKLFLDNAIKTKTSNNQ